jgi:hypothetical protein
MLATMSIRVQGIPNAVIAPGGKYKGLGLANF